MKRSKAGIAKLGGGTFKRVSFLVLSRMVLFHYLSGKCGKLGQAGAILACLWAGLPGHLTGPVPAPPAASARVVVKDLSPKFLAFYRAAQQEHATPARRWALWKQLYDFAATPPTPAGDTIARRLLDAAWPRYAAVLPQLAHGAAAMRPAPAQTLHAVAALLRPMGPVRLTVLAYVGGFEGNAFTNAEPGKITVALPLEIDSAARASLMAHEFTHALHIGMGSVRGGYIRTIGAIVVSEGLACRVRQHLFPGQPAAQSIEYTPGWLAAADHRQRAILQGIRPLLASETPADIQRFTMGPGPAGLEREAYYAGWRVVAYWRGHGESFADIARIPEAEMPRRVGEAIDQLLLLRPKP